MITQFMDMHSGGSAKEKPYEYIYIEAPEDEARSVFYSRFGHNPDRISCTCCGQDYSVTVYETLEDATVYERETYKYPDSLRNFERVVSKTVSEYMAQDDILLIPAESIEFYERSVYIPEEGWHWV